MRVHFGRRRDPQTRGNGAGFLQHFTGSTVVADVSPGAAPKAIRPEPAGKLMPMGKRVWESPPMPMVSGSSMRINHEWMTPSPGSKRTLRVGQKT